MSTERIIASFMRYGAFGAVATVAFGIFVMLLSGGFPDASEFSSLTQFHCDEMCTAIPGGAIVVIGLMALVGVSVGRLVLCAVLFLHEGDPHMALISIATVVLVGIAAFFKFMS